MRVNTVLLVRMLITVFLGIMFIAVASEVLKVSAQVDEAELEMLVNKKFEELDRRDKLLGWIIGILGALATVGGTIFAFRFKQHWNLDKTINDIRTNIQQMRADMGQIREDVQYLYGWCERLANRIHRFRDFQVITIVLFIVYGVALVIICVIILN